MRRVSVLAGVAFALLAGGAGWSLAQDNVVTPPPSFVPPPDANTVSPAAPTPLDIPPAEEAPPETQEAPPPPPPIKTPVAPPANAVANTLGNTVAELPPPPPPPPKRPRYTAVVLQALDKVTAETLRFEARVDEPVRYKDLVITVRACETAATDEPYAQTPAHLEVQYQPDVLGARSPPSARQVFRGWMYADSPGLHPFEHPIYDVWVIACRTPPPAPPAATTSAAPAPPVAGAHL